MDISEDSAGSVWWELVKFANEHIRPCLLNLHQNQKRPSGASTGITARGLFLVGVRNVPDPDWLVCKLASQQPSAGAHAFQRGFPFFSTICDWAASLSFSLHPSSCSDQRTKAKRRKNLSPESCFTDGGVWKVRLIIQASCGAEVWKTRGLNSGADLSVTQKHSPPSERSRVLSFASGASNEQISLNVTKIQDESHICTSATFKGTLKSLKYLLNKLRKVFLSWRKSFPEETGCPQTFSLGVCSQPCVVMTRFHHLKPRLGQIWAVI